MTLWRRKKESKEEKKHACLHIYIVEVRDRMLILAASRLSMMALGSGDREQGGGGGGKRGGGT